MINNQCISDENYSDNCLMSFELFSNKIINSILRSIFRYFSSAKLNLVRTSPIRYYYSIYPVKIPSLSRINLLHFKK